MADFQQGRQTLGVDRLKRRINNYRNHSTVSNHHFEATVGSIYSDQHKQTLLLKQRHIESKVKKNTKKSDKKQDSSSLLSTMGQSKLLARGHDQATGSVESSEEPAAKKQRLANGSIVTSVSSDISDFQIVQQLHNIKSRNSPVPVTSNATVPSNPINSLPTPTVNALNCQDALDVLNEGVLGSGEGDDAIKKENELDIPNDSLLEDFGELSNFEDIDVGINLDDFVNDLDLDIKHENSNQGMDVFFKEEIVENPFADDPSNISTDSGVVNGSSNGQVPNQVNKLATSAASPIYPHYSNTPPSSLSSTPSSFPSNSFASSMSQPFSSVSPSSSISSTPFTMTSGLPKMRVNVSNMNMGQSDMVLAAQTLKQMAEQHQTKLSPTGNPVRNSINDYSYNNLSNNSVIPQSTSLPNQIHTNNMNQTNSIYNQSINNEMELKRRQQMMHQYSIQQMPHQQSSNSHCGQVVNQTHSSIQQGHQPAQQQPKQGQQQPQIQAPQTQQQHLQTQNASLQQQSGQQPQPSQQQQQQQQQQQPQPQQQQQQPGQQQSQHVSTQNQHQSSQQISQIQQQTSQHPQQQSLQPAPLQQQTTSPQQQPAAQLAQPPNSQVQQSQPSQLQQGQAPQLQQQSQIQQSNQQQSQIRNSLSPFSNRLSPMSSYGHSPQNQSQIGGLSPQFANSMCAGMPNSSIRGNYPAPTRGSSPIPPGPQGQSTNMVVPNGSQPRYMQQQMMGSVGMMRPQMLAQAGQMMARPPPPEYRQAAMMQQQHQAMMGQPMSQMHQGMGQMAFQGMRTGYRPGMGGSPMNNMAGGQMISGMNQQSIPANIPNMKGTMVQGNGLSIPVTIGGSMAQGGVGPTGAMGGNGMPVSMNQVSGGGTMGMVNARPTMMQRTRPPNVNMGGIPGMGMSTQMPPSRPEWRQMMMQQNQGTMMMGPAGMRHGYQQAQQNGAMMSQGGQMMSMQRSQAHMMGMMGMQSNPAMQHASGMGTGTGMQGNASISASQMQSMSIGGRMQQHTISSMGQGQMHLQGIQMSQQGIQDARNAPNMAAQGHGGSPSAMPQIGASPSTSLGHQMGGGNNHSNVNQMGGNNLTSGLNHINSTNLNSISHQGGANNSTSVNPINHSQNPSINAQHPRSPATLGQMHPCSPAAAAGAGSSQQRPLSNPSLGMNVPQVQQNQSLNSSQSLSGSCSPLLTCSSASSGMQSQGRQTMVGTLNPGRPPNQSHASQSMGGLSQVPSQQQQQQQQSSTSIGQSVNTPSNVSGVMITKGVAGNSGVSIVSGACSSNSSNNPSNTNSSNNSNANNSGNSNSSNNNNNSSSTSNSSSQRPESRGTSSKTSDPLTPNPPSNNTNNDFFMFHEGEFASLLD